MTAVASELIGPIHVKRGDEVFSEGDTDRPSMFVVKSGSVGLKRHALSHGVDTEGPSMCWTRGRCFGEMCALTGLPRTGTVVALEGETELFELTKESFDRLRETIPQFGAKIATLVESRIVENSTTDRLLAAARMRH
jgi:CRP-like cAMP-binding protein